jgi:hypothetical protein
MPTYATPAAGNGGWSADVVSLEHLLVAREGVEWTERLVRNGARAVWLSVRRPPNLPPREVAGWPVHPLAVALRGSPIMGARQNARLLQRFFLRRLERLRPATAAALAHIAHSQGPA